MDKIPMLAADLIEELDKEFPNRWPSLDEPDRSIWFKAGQRYVVDHLLAVLEEQKEQDLKGREV